MKNKTVKTDLILILDFGSQYTQLIARRTRENKVYSEIQPFNIDVRKYLHDKSGYELKGVILSGGPSSVLDKDSPILSEENFKFFIENKIPVLGICYGLQLLVYINGGKIHKSNVREYGNTKIKTIKSNSRLLKGTGKKFTVWMSHGDSIDRLPKDFEPTSKSTNNILSSFESTDRKLFGLQFHPEVDVDIVENWCSWAAGTASRTGEIVAAYRERENDYRKTARTLVGNFVAVAKLKE